MPLQSSQHVTGGAAEDQMLGLTKNCSITLLISLNRRPAFSWDMLEGNKDYTH